MPASTIAFVSSIHLAFVALRSHRSSTRLGRFVLIPISLAASLTPWLYPEWSVMTVGFFAHLAFFAATDSWAMRHAVPNTAVVATSRTPAPRTVSSLPAPAGGGAPSRPAGFVPLTVLAVLDETPDIRTFRFARPDGFDFAAGQFLTVRVRIDGKDLARCYSISSAPSARGFLEISVKRQGVVSNALHATLRVGATLPARSPAGAFTYPDDDRPLVLIAGGVGITPMISMLRHAVTTQPQRPVTLVQSARTVEGLAYADELRVIERRFPHVRWVPAVSAGSDSTTYFPGRIDGALLATTVSDLREPVVCMCGPGSMIDDLSGALRELGLPEGQIRYERFEAAIAASGAAARDQQAAVADPAAGEVSVTFSRSGRRTVCQGRSLLEAAEEAGVDIPSLCRAGVCGTCRTRVIEGDIKCDSTVLPPGDRASGFVLACVTRAQGPCVVEA